MPAVQAALIQSLSFLIVLMLAYGMPLLAGIQLMVAVAAVLQGVIASLVSRLCRLAPWWQIIQFVFPMALVMTLALQLSPHVFLAAFLVFWGLYWSTFRTQVPFYPSNQTVWRVVADFVPENRSIRFIDIGSGFGGLALYLAARRPQSIFAGIELAPVPWFASWVRAHMTRGGAHFIRGDYDRLNFASYDVIFAYLSTAAMPALWEKACAEMRAGTLLLSYEFLIPGVKPHVTRIPIEGGPTLYGWYM